MTLYCLLKLYIARLQLQTNTFFIIFQIVQRIMLTRNSKWFDFKTSKTPSWRNVMPYGLMLNNRYSRYLWILRNSCGYWEIARDTWKAVTEKHSLAIHFLWTLLSHSSAYINNEQSFCHSCRYGRRLRQWRLYTCFN